MQLQRRLSGDARGRFPSVPWDCRIIKDSEEEVVLKACITTLRSPFRLEKEISLKRDESAITIRESLHQSGKGANGAYGGHHPTVENLFWIAAGLTQMGP